MRLFINPTNLKIKYLLEVLTESLALEWNIYHLGHTSTHTHLRDGDHQAKTT